MPRRFLLPCLAVLVAACGSDSTDPTDGPDGLSAGVFAGVVSDPVGGAASTRTTPLSPNLGGGRVPMAWVSMEPGTAPGGAIATIRNLSGGTPVTAPVSGGGFDPVSIPATADDTLIVSIARPSGAIVHAKAAVPARRRPRLVRTSPARGTLDVAINASIVVVFSEPIADSAVNDRRIRLLHSGRPVAGTVARVAGSAVAVEFTPAEPMMVAGHYQLLMDEGIVDQTGDRIEGNLAVDFSTSIIPPAAEPEPEPEPVPPPPPLPPPPAPAPGTLTLTYYGLAINFELAGTATQRTLYFHPNLPAPAGTVQAVTTGDAGFAVVSDGCRSGWYLIEDYTTCHVTVEFRPTGEPRAYDGTLLIQNSAGPNVEVPLFATTADATLRATATGTLPTHVMVGYASDPVTVTVTNIGLVASAPLATRRADCTFWMDYPDCAPLTASESAIQVTNDGCDGVVLDPGASCTLMAAFAPRGLHYHTENLYFDRIGSAWFAVQGTGTGLTAGPQQYNFPTVSVGADVTGSTVVTNMGDRPSGTITVDLSGTGFSLVSGGDGCTGLQLAPGGSCSVAYRFTPTVTGAHYGSLRFNAMPGGPVVSLITGTAR